MTTIELRGCRPQPLLCYLKALGVFRLVGEQADVSVQARWTPRGLQLTTVLSDAALRSFLLDEYVPTPIIAPWNGRSGFFLEKDRSSEKLLESVRELDQVRLEPLQEAIEVGLRLHRIADEEGWDRKKDKDRWITYCRNHMPERAVAWFDAVAVLAEDDPVFPIVLGGSGGNLGSMDLGNNWLQHLVDVLALPVGNGATSPDRSVRWLGDALDGTATEPANKAAIGQFDPGRAGGVNMERARDKGYGARWVNPWDFVLAMEGTVMFAAGVARQVGREGGRGVAAMPFTVRSSGVGHSDGAADESSSGELWLPVWSRFATLGEVRRLFGEARAQWDGRQATTGLDFVQAVTTLGADRGIDAFARVDVVERLGQSSLAVPAGRIRVVRRPESTVLAPVDRWLGRVRRVSNLPGPVARALRRVEATQYQTAAAGGSGRLRELLLRLADLQIHVGRSGTVREAVPPVVGLDAEAWLSLLDDDTPEFALASALASLRDPGGTAQPRDDTVTRGGSLARVLLPVGRSDGRRRWTGRPAAVTGLGSRPLPQVLADVLRVRAMRSPSGSREQGEDPDVSLPGVEPWFVFGRSVAREHVEAFAAGQLDDRRITEWLLGLLLLDWEWTSTPATGAIMSTVAPRPVPAWRLLAPFFSARFVTVRASDSGRLLRLRLRPEAAWPSQLVADELERVLRHVTHRQRVAGLRPLVGSDMRTVAASTTGPRVAAALLPHLGPSEASWLLRTTTSVAELEEPTIAHDREGAP